MGPAAVAAFLTNLATSDKVSASTQNQALCALVFLYTHVLHRPLGALPAIARVRTPPRLPVVLARAEVRSLLAQLTGVPRLVVALLYGSGLRLLEALSLRVKDVDLDRREIVVHQGKGRKDRITMLPASLVPDLVAHLEAVQRLHDTDLARGFGRVVLPDALDAKYPNAGRSWPWQFVFPAGRICTDPRWGPPSRFHTPRVRHPAGRRRRRTPRGHSEARQLPHAAPLVRHTPAGRWLRHQNRPGAARSRGREHDDDLIPMC